MPHDVNRCEMDIAARIRSTLTHQIGFEQINLWFGATSSWEMDGASLCITLPNLFLADCVRKFCWNQLKAVVSEVAGQSTAIRLKHAEDLLVTKPGISNCAVTEKAVLNVNQVITDESVSVDKLNRGIPFPSENRSGGKFSARDFQSHRAPSPPSVYCGKDVDQVRKTEETAARSMKSDYWDQIIAGGQNRLAMTAAQMVLERPGTITPLLLHGPCGVGKTHLARAIGEQLRMRHGLRRVIFMTAEQFTIDFTDSVRGSGFANFRRKYRDVEALILDDIQFLLGKKSTFSEFKNTIDNLLRNRRQVILVADRSLPELAGFGSELHARLSGGMSCVLEPLDVGSRLELLRRLCQEYAIQISENVLGMLASMASGDARILHGLVFRLMTEQRSKERAISDDEALRCTAELLRASQPIIRLSDIDKAICDVFGLEPKSLQTKGKSKSVSQPRMLAMFLARKYTRAAYSEIGEYFGNRQHSTVISAHKKVEDWLARNEPLGHRRGVLPVRDMMRNLESALQVG